MQGGQEKTQALIKEISKNLFDKKSMDLLIKHFSKEPSFSKEEGKCLFCKESEVRIRNESVLFAKILIEQKMENISPLAQKIKIILNHIASFYEIDNFFYRHLLHCLQTLKSRKDLQKQVLRQSVPILNSWTEKIIRNGLFLNKKEKISSSHVQILTLSSYFHPLRQNVGSCFATAPAMIIQKEQPEQFLNDLEALMNTGMLKRTYLGHEHAIPISTSWGPGILNKMVVVSEKQNFWESSELIYSLSEADFFDQKDSVRAKQAKLKAYFDKRLKYEENKFISVNELIEKILKLHFDLEDADTSKPFDAISLKVNEILYNDYSLSKPFGKVEQFQEALKKARLALINFHENPLLKTWEYTFASFAETKSEFYKWNLYVSLGFDSKKPFSIGSCIYSYLEECLKTYEEKIEFYDKEYEQEFYRVKMLEKRVMDSESEKMAGWARVEYQNHLNEMNSHKANRDNLIAKTERLSKLLPKILKAYDQLFPAYFQEVYDASMHEVSNDVFQDSPAGFRLLYKHGRSDPTLWTFIYSKDEFIHYLKEFLTDTEFEVSSQEELKEFKDEYAKITTKLIHLIETDNFIYGAFQRICDRYQISFPSHDLTKLEKWPYKPWSYISGGTPERLMQHYFKRELEFTQNKQKVASETELMAFIVDTVRDMTESQIQDFMVHPKKSMLMLSPNHVFLFKPGFMPLAEIWNKDLYSFSWIRDNLVHPQLRFLEGIKVSPLEVHYFFNTYFSQFPYFSLWIKENIHWPNYQISLVELREILTNSLKKTPKQFSPFSVNLETVDSWIYECFPLLASSELYRICHQVIKELKLSAQDYEKASSIIEKILDSTTLRLFIRPFELYEVLSRVLAILYGKVRFEKDWPIEILKALRSLNLSMPKPLTFADTNWPYFNFSFLVSPATFELELWRTSPLGNKGFPMHQWKNWFSEEKAGEWSILVQPDEYLSNS